MWVLSFFTLAPVSFITGCDYVQSFMEELIQKGADIHVLTPDFWTPLHLAAWYGHTDIVPALLTRS